MSRGNALGFIESVGLASAIAAADAALKAANVELVGRENSRGSGYITIKIAGDVGAVKAAISAAKASAENVSRVWSTDVIPRPAKDLGGVLVWNKDTQGADDWFLSRDLDAGNPAPVPKKEEEAPKEEDSPAEEKAPEETKTEEITEEKSLAVPPKQEIVAVPDEEKPKPVVQPPKKPTGNKPPGRRKKK